MENPNMLEAIYRMTKENNEMLHSMRRNAFLGGAVKFMIYVFFLVAPVWFYMTYLNTTVQELVRTAQQLQGSDSQTSALSGGGFSEQLLKLQALMPDILKKLQQASTSAHEI